MRESPMRTLVLLSALGLGLIAWAVGMLAVPWTTNPPAGSSSSRIVADKAESPEAARRSELEAPVERKSNHEQMGQEPPPPPSKAAVSFWTPDPKWIAEHQKKTL